MERERRAQAERAKLGRGRFARPESPAWTVDAESVTVSAPSGRTVSSKQTPEFFLFTPLENPCQFLISIHFLEDPFTQSHFPRSFTPVVVPNLFTSSSRQWFPPGSNSLVFPRAIRTSRKVVDIWDLPVPTRHLSSMKRSLTSSMRRLPRTSAEGTDGSSVSFASEGGKPEILPRRRGVKACLVFVFARSEALREAFWDSTHGAACRVRVMIPVVLFRSAEGYTKTSATINLRVFLRLYMQDPSP